MHYHESLSPTFMLLWCMLLRVRSFKNFAFETFSNPSLCCNSLWLLRNILNADEEFAIGNEVGAVTSSIIDSCRCHGGKRNAHYIVENSVASPKLDSNEEILNELEAVGILFHSIGTWYHFSLAILGRYKIIFHKLSNVRRTRRRRAWGILLHLCAVFVWMHQSQQSKLV